MKQSAIEFPTCCSRTKPSRSNVLLVLFVAAVAFIVNANTLGNKFVYDDHDNVLRNPWITESGSLAEAFTHHMAAFSHRYDTSYYRPMMHVILAAAHKISGFNPWGFHLVVVLLHAIASGVIFLIIVRLFSSTRSETALPFQLSALFGALVFAVHPIHAEAVAWISGVVDVSYSLFFLLALFSALSDKPTTRLGAAPALFFLSLLSKEPAVMLLPVLIVIFAAQGDLFDPERRRKAAFIAGLLLAILAAYLAVRVYALGGFMGTGGAHRVRVSPWEGIWTAFALLGEYMRLLVFPWPLSALHATPICRSLMDYRPWIGLLVISAIFALVVRHRKTPGVLPGVALCLLPLLPALYVPVLGEGLLAERYLYLPSVGIAILAATVFRMLAEHSGALRRLLTIIIASVLMGSAAASIARNKVWHDDVSLWSDAASKFPENAQAHEYLGFALYQSGQFASSAESLSRSLVLDPTRTDARVNLAGALSAMGRMDEAIAEGQQIVQEHPRVAEIHGILGFALASKGRLREAETECRTALAIDPDLASVHNQLGIILAQERNIAGAISEFREAVRLKPDSSSYARNLSLLTKP